jgi:hypothetical protein
MEVEMKILLSAVAMAALFKWVPMWSSAATAFEIDEESWKYIYQTIKGHRAVADMSKDAYAFVESF